MDLSALGCAKTSWLEIRTYPGRGHGVCWRLCSSFKRPSKKEWCMPEKAHYFGQAYLFVFPMLKIKPRVWHMIDTYSTTGLHLQPLEMHVYDFIFEKWKKTICVSIGIRLSIRWILHNIYVQIWEISKPPGNDRVTCIRILKALEPLG